MAEDEKKEPEQNEPKRKEPELRKISREELEQILAAHKKWVEEGMNPKKPGRAGLHRVDLQGIIRTHRTPEGLNLEGARLEGASLWLAHLARAFLNKAHLQGAHLWLAHLDGAYLNEAHLEGADLGEAHLEGAFIFRAHLDRAYLRKAHLDGAYLNEAHLEGAYLREAHLDGANLTLANFDQADLRDAKLQGAILRHTDLSGALNLDVRELAGADLFMTKLPPDIAKFEGLKTVDEAAKKCSHLFTIMLLGCLYAWLVGFGYMGKGNEISIPFIYNAHMTRQGFSLLAPPFLLGLWFYLLLYAERLWEPLSMLPAIFPDGTPLDKKAHPWLPLGYLRAHVPRLRKDRPPLSRLQTALINVLLFWLVPATVGLFWFRSLEAGLLGAAIFDGALTWLACLLAETFIYQARHTLRRLPEEPYRELRGLARLRAFTGFHAWVLARLLIYAEALAAYSLLNWPH